MSTNVGKAYVQIVPTTEGISGEIDALLNNEMGNSGEKSGESWASKFGAVAKSALATLGVGKVISEAFNSGAELEQSIGGIETLFGTSSDKMMEYASKAYETAGISANEYMQQTTSFAASLLNSLDGDTAKAADAADRAMRDMSDNANKMGTSMESIQNAYQGFSKQNYTMLDNLKLGYGGTKEEMVRLIADASQMTTEMEKLGVSVDKDDMSFGNIVNAISVMQEHMGIAGTTASEASQTISGSLGSMKAAWSDLLANVTLGNEIDLGPLTTTVTNFIANAIPALTNIITQLPTALITLLSGLAPTLMTSGVQMITGLVSGVSSQLPALVPVAVEMIRTIGTGLIEAIPQLLEAATQLISSLCAALVELIPELVLVGIDLFTALITELPTIIVTLTAAIPEIVMSIVDAVLNNLDVIIQAGIELFVALIGALPTIIVQLLTAIPLIISELVMGFINKISEMENVGQRLLDGLKTGILNALSSLLNAIVSVGRSIIQAFKDVFGIASPSKELAEIGGYMMSGLAGGIEDNTGLVSGAMGDVESVIRDGVGTDYSVKANICAATSAMKASAQTGWYAASEGQSGAVVINIGEMSVREEADIQRIAAELSHLIRSEYRKRGQSYA